MGLVEQVRDEPLTWRITPLGKELAPLSRATRLELYDFVEETKHSSLRQGVREHRVNEGDLFSGLSPPPDQCTNTRRKNLHGVSTHSYAYSTSYQPNEEKGRTT